MVRIHYFVCVFSNGINDFLKAERTLKMTNFQVVRDTVSTLQTVTKVNEIVC